MFGTLQTSSLVSDDCEDCCFHRVVVASEPCSLFHIYVAYGWTLLQWHIQDSSEGGAQAGARYEKLGGGGGGGGAVGFWPNMKSEGGGCRFLARYEKRGGGGGGGAVGFWPDTNSGGEGGGGAVGFWPDTNSGGEGGVVSVSGPIQARIQNVLKEGSDC